MFQTDLMNITGIWKPFNNCQVNASARATEQQSSNSMIIKAQAGRQALGAIRQTDKRTEIRMTMTHVHVSQYIAVVQRQSKLSCARTSSDVDLTMNGQMSMDYYC